MSDTRSRSHSRTVVFDMGGVLTVDPFAACREYAVELGLPEQTFVELLKGEEFGRVETGDLSMREFLKYACSDVETRLGERVDIRRLAAAFASGQQLNPGTVRIVEELAAAGVRMAVLTNNAKEARSWWNSPEFPSERFDFVLDSSEIGVRKPDPRIFEALARKLGGEPHDIVFFDDLLDNVLGAKQSGLDAVLFDSVDGCRLDLVERKLL